jgi:transposase
MYKCGERHQIGLFPIAIEDYIGPNDPVRVYDTFVEAIDFNTLGIPITPNKEGAHEYHPRTMLKLFLYGYSYGGTRSSRKLERACHHNLSFIWLMGGLKPDYRTIARFRRENKEAIKKVLKESARLCLELNLIEGNILFVDGSPIRANASIDNTWTTKKTEKYLKQVEANIDKLITEAEEIDQTEEWQDSLVNIKEELRDNEKLKKKIEDIAQRLKASGRQNINSVDAKSVNVKGRQGSHASYRGDLVVDEKHGLIVQSEAVSQSSDLNQFNRQMKQAGENIGHSPEQGCADAGFYSLPDLDKVTSVSTIVMPSSKQAQADNKRHPLKPFSKEEFKYDQTNDEYICPEGKRLKYCGQAFGDNRKRQYQAEGKECRVCPQFGICTKCRVGRSIIRMKEEELKERLAQIYESADGQVVYKLRKQKAELPFGHIKRNLGAGQFLLRGKSGADAELSMLGTCFNIARMITIIGIPGLITKLISS